MLTKLQQNFLIQKNSKDIILMSVFLVLILFSVFLINPLAGALSAGIVLLVLLFAYYQEIGLYVLAFSIPITNWYIPVEIFNINYLGFAKDFRVPFVDLVGIFLFVGFLARQIYYIFYDREKFKKLQWPVIGAFLCFFAIALLSAINAHSWFGSVWYSVRWLLFFYFVYICLPVNIISSKKVLRNVMISFVLSGLAISLMGLASLFQQDWDNDFVRFKPIGFWGIYPIGYNQKQISELLVSAVLLVLALKYWFVSRWSRGIIYGLYILFMIVLLGSFSRAAWLIAFFQLIFFLVYYRREIFSSYKKTIVVVTILCLLLIPLSYYMIALQGSSVGLSSNKHRFLLNNIAWQGFVNHPLIGSGSGDYFYLEEQSIRYQATHAGPMDSHGIWQKIGSEMGALGLLTFLAFISFLGCYVYRKFKEIPSIRDKSLLIYLTVAVASIFLFEFFDTQFYRGKLWFVAGLMLAGVKVLNNKKMDYKERLSGN